MNKQPKSDFFTTSSDFKPDEKKYFHWKRLNPDIEGYKSGNTLLVRNKLGVDTLIEFVGEVQQTDETDELSKEKWKCRYKIIEEKRKESYKRNVPKNLKDQIIDSQNNKCKFCGDKFNSKNPSEIDHRVEWSLGGLTQEDNLDALCKSGCHELKSIYLKKLKGKGAPFFIKPGYKEVDTIIYTINPKTSEKTTYIRTYTSDKLSKISKKAGLFYDK